MRSRTLAPISAPLLLLGACILDLGDLTGGQRDGGATGGSAAHGTGSATSTAGTTGATTTSASTGTGGAAPTLFDCDPCPSGGCGVTALASGADADGPRGIALDTDALYWVNQPGGAVMRLAASGGAPQKIAAANGPIAVAALDGYVVWAEQGGVYGCPAASCASNKIKIAGATLNGSIQGVAYDGQFVFYTDRTTAGTTGKATRCPPAAGCPGAQDLGTNLWLPAGISFHNDQVYWADVATGNQNGSIARSPKAGGGMVQVAAVLDLPTSVVADDMYAYWTEATATGGKVRRCPWSSYCMTIDDLATGLAAPLDLAIGNGRVYWSDSGDGKILSCPASGCGASPPRVHASGLAAPRRVALGATCVFFTDDTGGGSVSKVAR
jgi:hypothetical protein